MNQADARDQWSKRARILKRVLDWVNQGRYEDYESWMLFGRMGADTGGETKVLLEKGDPEDEALHEMTGDLQVQAGRLVDARHTSLEGRAPKPSIRGMEDLSTWEPGPHWRAAAEPDQSEIAEYLDAKYSVEVIGKLEKIVRRAALLNPHDVNVSQIHDENVQACFSAAHGCYLYGFNAACAVMCRAILESALKAKLDPDHKIEDGLKKGQSLFKELIGRAGLDDPLPGAAEEVKRSGDCAAHDYREFQKEYESKGKIEHILGTTRAVLAALYPQPPDSQDH